MTSNELEIFKQSILDDVRVMMQTTGQVTQYIGARYVPLFAESLDWSAEREYEPLTIVLDHGNSFTSRQFVPRGIDISNTEFWANTGNYNAQIEQYRQEVMTFDSRIQGNTTAIGENTTAIQQNNREIEDLKTYHKTELLIIADSYSYEGTHGAIWVPSLASSLGLNVHNYSFPGAGFAYDNGEGTLSKGIEKAKAEISDPQSVKYVVVIGGVNDITRNIDPSTLSTKYAKFVQSLISAFGKADSIHLFVPNMKEKYDVATYVKYLQVFTTPQNGVALHPEIRYWFNIFGTYNDDGTHPYNSSTPAKFIANTLNGGGAKFTAIKVATFESGVNPLGDKTFEFMDSTMKRFTNIRIPSASVTANVIKLCSFGKSISKFGVQGSALVTWSGATKTYIVPIELNDTGELSAIISQEIVDAHGSNNIDLKLNPLELA